MKNLRSHNNIRTANIEMYLFIKMGYELKLSYNEIKDRYQELLEDNTSDTKYIQKMIDKLYRIHYTHFKNK